MRQALSRVSFVLLLGALACSLNPAQLAPEVIPPTIRPTDPPTVNPTQPPTAAPATAGPGGAVVARSSVYGDVEVKLCNR